MVRIPKTMTAIAITEPGGPDVLQPEERPVPVPGEGEILVAVAAAGVNRPDVMQRKGHYPPPPGAPDIPGLEMSGVVAALGKGVDALEGGRRGHRPRRRRRLRRILPDRRDPTPCRCPSRSRCIESAGASRDHLHRLVERLPARRSPARRDLPRPWRHQRHRHDRDPARQGLRRLRHRDGRLGARNARPASTLGADVAINYKEADFVEAVKKATGGKGADVILDMVGGDYVARNYIAAARGGAHRPDRHPGRRQADGRTSCR